MMITIPYKIISINQLKGKNVLQGHLMGAGASCSYFYLFYPLLLTVYRLSLNYLYLFFLSNRKD